MFIKCMMRTHRHDREALAMDRLKHQERTDGLIHRLHEVRHRGPFGGDQSSADTRSLFRLLLNLGLRQKTDSRAR
jgi:hypothetical protein